jgi:HD domain
MSTTQTEKTSIAGVEIPDSKLAREATELVRDTESPLLFNHSTRVYYFGALAGAKRGLKFDPELLYIGAMFHDMGLTPRYSSKADRFEVDGANSARAFLGQYKISEQDIDTVWTAIALHTTPGIPQYMHPVVALVTAGVEMDCARHRVRRFLGPLSGSRRTCVSTIRVLQRGHYPGVLRRY